ncbi:MAG: TolC family protein [Gemmatimonadales bacterium]
MDRIRATNPDLIARRGELEAASARARAAGFAPASVLSGEVEELPGGVDVGRAGSIRIALEHEFLSGGRRGAARSVAGAEVEALSAELEVAERRAATLAVAALAQSVDWLGIAWRLAEQDSLLSSAQVSLQTRFTAGQARYVDILRLRTERLRAEAEQAAAATEARVSRRSLLTLLARGDSIPAPDSVLVDSVIATRLASTATVLRFPAPPSIDSLLVASGATRLAEAGLARAKAQRHLLLANRHARFTAFAGAQRFAGENGNHIIGPVLGGSISLPFTAAAANAAAAAAAERGVEAAAAQRDALLAARRGALLVARDRYEAARARLAVYDPALLQGAHEERESALAAYRNGSLSLIELLDFERALSRAEIDRLRSQIDAEAALTALLSGGDSSVSASASPFITPVTSDAP